MKKLFFTFLLCSCVGNALASVIIDSIAYNLNETELTAEVTYNGTRYYSGSVVIPKSITYDTKTYSITSIGYETFSQCSGLTSVTIPNSITNIGDSAFYKCTSLRSITIPNSVISIGNGIFHGCSRLNSITLSNNIINIGDYAFFGCRNLTSIEIPNSVTSIGVGAFWLCERLSSVIIPNSVTSIGGAAFLYCNSLTSVNIPNSVTSIGEQAFAHCIGLTSITIPNSVTSIGETAFMRCDSLITIDVDNENPNYCSMDGVLFNKDRSTLIQYPGGKNGDYIIPNSVVNIGRYAFYVCTGLTFIEFPNSVTSLGFNAFAGCSGLTSIKIPNSITSIGDEAFISCSGLTSIEIPNSVTYIERRAFAYCDNLTFVICEATMPPIMDSFVFEHVDCSAIPLYVPVESISAYKAADQWKDFNPIRPIGYTEYTITFVNWNDSILLELPVEEGVIPEYTGATPTRSADEDYTYTFSGWSPDIVAANQDATYIAQYMAIPIGQDTIATEETEEDVYVNATPTEEGSVILEWPAVENADTYTITIAKNGEIICTLVFDDEGRLISIAFGAPARDGNSRNVPAAEKAAKGWRYEVKGLEPDTEYAYTVMAKQNETVLFSETLDFTMPAPQGINDINAATKSQKIVRDNQVLILRGEKTYTVTGQEVK